MKLQEWMTLIRQYGDARQAEAEADVRRSWRFMHRHAVEAARLYGRLQDELEKLLAHHDERVNHGLDELVKQAQEDKMGYRAADGRAAGTGRSLGS